MNSFMPGIEVDADAVEQQADNLEQQLQDNAAFVETLEQNEEEEATADKQEQAQLDDPRSDGVGLNVPDIVAETKAAVTGGLQDSISSGATLFERTGDMFNGEMAAAGDDYKPEWDPTGADGENKIVTNTWWGGFLRGAIHFGTMAGATVLAAKGIAALGIGAGVSAGAGWLAGGATSVGGKFAAASAVGAIGDLGSKYSQDDNALGVLRDRYGFIDTPISTKDTDHPAMMTVKNTLEGMGIGAAFEGLGMLIKRGTKVKVKDVDGNVKEVPAEEVQLKEAAERSESIKEQVETRGKEQFNEEGFGAYKNHPISDPWQGSPTSTGKADVALEQLSRTRNEWGAEMGSTYSQTTPSELNRYVQSSGLPDDIIIKKAEELMSAPKFKEGMAAIKSGRATPKEIWGESIEMYTDIVQGREILDINKDEFLDRLMSDSYVKDGVELMNPSKIAATDLIVGSLMREARDLGMAGRELGDIADLGAKDGPAERLMDMMITLNTETHKARFDWSQSGKEMAAGTVRKPSKSLKREAKQILKDLKQESKESLYTMLQLANKDTDDSLMKSIFEYVSQSNDLRNFEDLESWAKKKLKGGEFNGRKETGKLIDELGKVMVNSVLSGPKTPVRAIMGTSSATFLRPLSTALGAALGGNGQVARASLANLNAMVQMIPEAFTIFKTKVNSNFAGDINSNPSRFIEQAKQTDAVEWELMAKFYESDKATKGQKGAWRAANVAKNINNNNLFTYSTKLMQATDDTFRVLMARGQARQMAMMEAMKNGTDITPKLMKEYEAKFQNQIIDSDGTIRTDTDGGAALAYGTKEVTLTKQLDGFAAALDDAFQKTPWAKPFFLFARTSVNGLELMGKHTPLVNRLIKENQLISQATSQTLEDVAQYGIMNADQLANAKALMKGRVAIGYGVVSMSSMAALSGNLRGNGPTDRQMRQVWKDAGWKPNTIKLGDVWVNYEAFEPFNVMLTTIADIADHSQLMGEEWTKDALQKYALVVASGVTSKSYMAGLQQFTDLFAGDPKAWARMGAGLANNQIPLSSLRNEIGKILSPGMRELSSSFADQIRNRNQGLELLAGKPLPIKYDMLSGKPIKDYDLPTKLFNAVSPIQFNLDETPGRKMLFESQYDMRMSVMSAPSTPPISLRDNSELRSMFQRSLGNQGLDLTLNRIAARPEVQLEMKRMNADRDKGGDSKKGDPMGYLHNRLIKEAFDRARKKAWADIAKDPRVQELIEEQRGIDRLNYNTKSGNRKGREEALKDLQTMHK